MMSLHASDNEQLIRQIYEAFVNGDMVAIAAAYADGVILHVPGIAPGGGDFTGKGEVFTWYATLLERSAKSFRIRLQAIHGWAAQVVVFYEASVQRAGVHYGWQGVELYSVVNGKVVEIWNISLDRACTQAFWAEDAGVG